MNQNAGWKRVFDADDAFRRLALTRDRSIGVSVLIGLSATLAGFLVRALLESIPGGYFAGIGGFTIYLAFLLLASLTAGRIAGFTALLASTVTGAWMSWTSGTGDLRMVIIGVGLFVVVGTFCVVVAASLRRTIQGLEDSRLAISEASARIGETENRFRLLSEDAPVMLWMTDEVGTCVHLNKAQRDFWGAPDDLESFDWSTTVHPDDLGTMQAIFDGALAEQTPFTVEGRYTRFDGATRVLHTQGSPRFDGAGRFVGMIGVNTDITAAKDATRALAAQERRNSFLLGLADRLRDVFDPVDIMAEVERSLGDVLDVKRVGYGEVDPERKVVVMSPDWTHDVASFQGEVSVEAFGADLISDLIEGRLIRIPDVRRDRRTKAAADAFAGIETRSLVRVPLIRAGRLRAFLYVHDSVVREWTDAEVSLIEEVAERTWGEIERARADIEIRESEERFRAIADTAPVLIWVTQEDRTRAFVNQAYVAYNGGAYDDARLADWRAVIHPDDHERIITESLAGEATGEPFSMEARYLRHDGEYRWLRSFSRPRFGAGGDIVGFVGVAFDITEAKRAETDLKRINELLEERVGDALAEKAKAEADLMHAQRMEAVGRLTGGVAHDFNNLLTVVIGALDIILRSPDDAAKRQKLGEAALAAARRGESLTHQLLAFSRRQSLRPEATDLNAQIREGEPLLKRAVGDAVDFKLKLRRGGAWAEVDRAQFEAALLNLVVNARDAVGQTGQIAIETGVIEVTDNQVQGIAAGRYVVVSVRDNGEGMSPETAARVFEPFFTTKSVGKGTGLGLSQVYGFSKQSGGGVSIDSRMGQGATVSIYLPNVAASTAQAPIARTASTALPRQSVLLVEDDAAVAAVAFDLLTEMGMDVTTAADGPSALNTLNTASFDIMLSDIAMPGMTGVELATQAEARWPTMSILLTSGYVGEEAGLTGAHRRWPLLRKPYTGEQLRSMLTRTLQKRESAAE